MTRLKITWINPLFQDLFRDNGLLEQEAYPIRVILLALMPFQNQIDDNNILIKSAINGWLYAAEYKEVR